MEYRDELALQRRETPDLGARAAEALVKLAQETRRLLSNGEMPGCVDGDPQDRDLHAQLGEEMRAELR